MPTPLIYAIADRMAPKVRQQFLSTVFRLQARITIPQLAVSVGQNGWTSQVVRAFADFETDLQKTLGASLQGVWQQAADATETELLRQLSLTASFNLVNPSAVVAAQQRTAFLIREVSSETKAAVRQIITRSIQEGIPPRTAAIQIRPLVGLTSRQSGAVQTFRQQLLAAGASASDANRSAERYATRLLKQRGETIARTETIRASVDGQQDAWMSARDQELIPSSAVQQWIVADDERLCPICRKLRNRTAPLGGTFKVRNGAVKGPPAHPRCRCALGLVYRRQRR